jgi:hypothetical protein
MLILDNADDAGFLFEAQPDFSDQPSDSNRAPRRLREYLPQSQSGSILLTTRSWEAGLKFVEQHDMIAVAPMNQDEAFVLLKRKLGVQGDSDDDNTTELADTLDFMPLAIVQAAAYISQRMPRFSVRQYLEKFARSERKRTNLLNHEGGQLHRDLEAKNSIIITWQISFDYIRDTRPSAADLLSLMSFFDRQGIPESLLRNRTQTEKGDAWRHQEDDDTDDEEDGMSQNDVSDVFEDDVVALRNFSFITDSTDGISFEMHRLVQLATRKWLEA